MRIQVDTDKGVLRIRGRGLSLMVILALTITAVVWVL